MDKKLKPCPFCGCTKIERYRNGNSHYAYCTLCSARAKNYSVATEIDIVIHSWNTRYKDCQEPEDDSFEFSDKFEEFQKGLLPPPNEGEKIIKP